VTRVGHTVIAFCASAIALAALPAAPLLAIGAALGANAPDDLELPQRDGTSMLPHRTLTHWPVVYIVAGLGAALLPSPWNALVIGLMLGALVHLAIDACSPHGIPWFSPMRARKGFAIYRTGSASEWRLIAPSIVTAAAAIYFRYDAIVHELQRIISSFIPAVFHH
jgi:inner membrane protein